jgi:uncharacterized membrane protein YccC
MTWPTWPEALTWLPLAAAGLAVLAIIAVGGICLDRRRRDKTGLAALRSDVAELAAQLEDFARRIDQRVDERLDRLQALLAEADKKQEALRRQIEAAAQGDGASGGASNAASGQVLVLAAQGLDSVEIARRLKIDVGEVELMLNLHRSSVSPKA